LGIRRAARLVLAFALSTVFVAPRASAQIAPGTFPFAVRLVPPTVAPGGAVTIEVTGMLPNSSVSVAVANVPGPPIGAGLAGPDGSASVRVPVPVTQPIGDMELVVAGMDRANAAQTVSVHVAIVADTMAVTGLSSTVLLTLLGAGFVGVGFALRHAAARRLAALRARLAPMRIRLRLRPPARRIRIRPRWGDPAAAVPTLETRRRVRLRLRP
jgi:hypothetical protein